VITCNLIAGWYHPDICLTSNAFSNRSRTSDFNSLGEFSGMFTVFQFTWFPSLMQIKPFRTCTLFSISCSPFRSASFSSDSAWISAERSSLVEFFFGCFGAVLGFCMLKKDSLKFKSLWAFVGPFYLRKQFVSHNLVICRLLRIMMWKLPFFYFSLFLKLPCGL